MVWSTGGIAELTGRSRDRIEYVIRTRGIQPAFVAGGRRLFDEEGIQKIKEAFDVIDGRRHEPATVVAQQPVGEAGATC